MRVDAPISATQETGISTPAMTSSELSKDILTPKEALIKTAGAALLVIGLVMIIDGYANNSNVGMLYGALAICAGAKLLC